jgi:hypothetical protein
MLRLLSPADAQRLREFLREAKYTREELERNRISLELPSRGIWPWSWIASGRLRF